MLYVDTPTTQDVADLVAFRAEAAVSLYLATTPLTQHVGASRIEFRHLVDEAARQLAEAQFDKRPLAALRESLSAIEDDDEFWRLQANSLAVFATPERVMTFRLANRLKSMVQVSDRFHVKPLLRAVTFPHEAFVLAVSENQVRLVQVFSDMPPAEVKVPGLPKDAASHAGKATLNERGGHRRLQDAQGERVRHLQYLRAIDTALRPILAGRTTPLVLAAVDPLASLFATVASYPRLMSAVIKESPDHMPDARLAAAAIPILDTAYVAEVAEVARLFETRAGQGRTATDLTDAARAATFGAVDTLLVDIDDVVPGTIDENGMIAFADHESATTYGVVDEIAGRVLGAGGRVYAVRRPEVPGGGPLAAILRYAV